MTERPSCGCHGEPMGWQKDARGKHGGYWTCRAKRREYNQRRSAERVAWARAKYSRDPVYRIQKRLHDDSRVRGERLKARKEQTPPNPHVAAFLKAVRPKGG